MAAASDLDGRKGESSPLPMRVRRLDPPRSTFLPLVHVSDAAEACCLCAKVVSNPRVDDDVGGSQWKLSTLPYDFEWDSAGGTWICDTDAPDACLALPTAELHASIVLPCESQLQLDRTHKRQSAATDEHAGLYAETEP